MTENEQVPQEIKGWNWGAFMFNAFWGIGNKTYLPLLSLAPFIGWIWPIIVGIKGNEWAWKKSGYANVPEDIRLFKATQATWNRAGIFAFIIGVISFICFFLVLIVLLMSDLNNGQFS